MSTPSTRRSTQELVPSFFEGSSTFFLMIGSWLIWTLVFPLSMIHSDWLSMIDSGQELANAMFLSGICYLLYSLAPLASSLATKHTVPIAHGSFLSQTNQSINQSVDSDSPQPYHIKVKHILVILNPYGGGKNNIDRWNAEALPVLSAAGISSTIILTDHEGHAHDIALNQPLSSNYDCIAVVGGDGTMSEVTNGLMKRPDGVKLPVALIPGGTGNALATDLGTLDFAKAAKRIVDGSVLHMDLMLLTSNSKSVPLHMYSVETITWGLVGNVAVESERAIMRLLGTARFNACAVWGVLKGFIAPLSITIDDPTFIDRSKTPVKMSSQQSNQSINQSNQSGNKSNQSTTNQPVNQSTHFSGHYVTAYINNTQYFAKLLRGAPYAHLDDGKFDILFLSSACRSEVLSLFGLLTAGSHVYSPKVKYIQANSVKFAPEQAGVLNVDGEVVEYEGEIEVKCIKRALPIMCETKFSGRLIDGLKE